MKIFGKNPIENFERKLKTAAIVFSMILSMILMIGATTYAQSIDDVLKPKPPITKPRSAVVKTPAETVKKRISQRAKKSSVPKTKTVNNSPVGKNVKSVKKRPSPAETVSSETPDQILTRYMNFRQSANVTDKDWNSVIAQTAKILESNPNHSIAKAQSFIAQGQIAYNQRDYSTAIIHFKSALQILPKSSLLHYSLGKAYLANGQAKAAADSFEEAVDQNEKFALAYKGIGDTAAAQGKTKKAAKYFKKATEIGVKDGNMNP